jgi:hypothetical protein
MTRNFNLSFIKPDVAKTNANREYALFHPMQSLEISIGYCFSPRKRKKPDVET